MTIPVPRESALNGRAPQQSTLPDEHVLDALARVVADPGAIPAEELEALMSPWREIAQAVRKGPDAAGRAQIFQFAIAQRPDRDDLVRAVFATQRNGEPIALSDMGNSRRFARQHRDQLRHVAAWGWLVWDGQRWQRDETQSAMRLARQTVRSILSEATESATESETQRLTRWALQSQSRSRMEAMVSLAQSEPGVPATTDLFDRDPWLFNAQNGALDLRTLQLQPHHPDDHMTHLASAPFLPDAECPTWLRFLSRIMRDNASLVGFLQRAVGYTLSGDTREQCLFFCYGTGANGKSTFTETLMTLLGDYATKTPTHTLMARRFDGVPNDVARLAGARLVVAAEVAEGRRLNESLVKDLTGGERIAARYLHREFFEFTPAFKLWMYGNHKPVIRGYDYGIWRRIRLVPFTETIPEPERDPQLKDKLRAELPGILAWAARGCQEWLQRGLGVPEEVRAATQAYQSEMDVLARFLEDCCVVAPDAQAGAGDLYRAFKQWCEQTGEPAQKQTWFGRRMAERGFEAVRSSNARLWKGVSLVTHDAFVRHDAL
jgi:putative DNA primase/helicase